MVHSFKDYKKEYTYAYSVVVADNYSNSSPEAIRRVEKITRKSVKLYEADICDKQRLNEITELNSSILKETSDDDAFKELNNKISEIIPQGMIRNEAKLRRVFFEIAVLCRVEEFLQSDPQIRLLFSLASYQDIFVEAVQDLLRKAPMLKAESCYFDITYFMEDFNNYRSLLVNLADTIGQVLMPIRLFC